MAPAAALWPLGELHVELFSVPPLPPVGSAMLLKDDEPVPSTLSKNTLNDQGTSYARPLLEKEFPVGKHVLLVGRVSRHWGEFHRPTLSSNHTNTGILCSSRQRANSSTEVTTILTKQVENVSGYSCIWSRKEGHCASRGYNKTPASHLK